MSTATQIQIRCDSSVSWGSANPTLALGEMAYETDKGRIKFGDGSTTYKSLSYFPTLSPFVLPSYDATTCKAVPTNGAIVWLTDYKSPAYCDGTVWHVLSGSAI